MLMVEKTYGKNCRSRKIHEPIDNIVKDVGNGGHDDMKTLPLGAIGELHKSCQNTDDSKTI